MKRAVPTVLHGCMIENESRFIESKMRVDVPRIKMFENNYWHEVVTRGNITSLCIETVR